MKHGRNDYDATIKDASGKIPEDEPVFLIRGQDRLGAAAVEVYAAMAEAAGLGKVAQRCRLHAAWMRNWLPKKEPD